MSGDNPYSPPASVEPAPPDRFFWHVRGIDVIVKDQAILPEIDLETGVEHPPLTASTLIWTGAYSIDRWMGILWFAPIISVAKSDSASFRNYLILFCILGGIADLIWRIKKRNRGFKISIFREASREQVNQRRTKNRTFLGLGTLTLIAVIPILMMVADVDPLWALASISAGLVLFAPLIASAIAAKKENPVRLSAGPDGWATLGPIHPQALPRLREIELRRNR